MKSKHTINGHNPTCLYPTHPCDCGKKKEDWRKELNKLEILMDGYDQDGQPVKMVDYPVLEQFIRQLLVKKSRRI